jgi:predicted CoA-substrate-specific enzyme activase
MTAAAIGLDAGSTTTKLVAVDAAGEVLWHVLEDTDPRMEAQAHRLVGEARERAGSPQVPVVATGYGRNLVKDATRKVTEITCHARGVYRSVGHGGTLVDIGGQDSKVIVIGPKGDVVNFAMNDKCAAGTGRFLEVVANRLKFSLSQLSDAVLSTDREASISSTCTVFAESEMISLMAQGTPVEDIVRGLVRALVRRVSAMARGAGVTPPLLLSGGVARSAAMRELLGQELRHEVRVPASPQLMGAYGAALSGLRGG